MLSSSVLIGLRSEVFLIAWLVDTLPTISLHVSSDLHIFHVPSPSIEELRQIQRNTASCDRPASV
jgi:hypothetical protein